MKTKSAFDLNNSCDIKSDEGIIKRMERLLFFFMSILKIITYVMRHMVHIWVKGKGKSNLEHGLPTYV